MKLEVVALPVSDADRAKRFNDELGWRLDLDYAPGDFRAIQFTTPGSGCSVMFGKNVSHPATHCAAEASRQARYFMTAAAYSTMPARQAASAPKSAAVQLLSCAAFSDPDGNGWFLQEVTVRLPGTATPASPARS